MANNVSQAQAFCIATACLQVPVFKKAELFKFANRFYEQSTNKWSLFRPSLLFGAKKHRWAAHSFARGHIDVYPSHSSQISHRSHPVDDARRLINLLHRRHLKYFRLLVDQKISDPNQRGSEITPASYIEPTTASDSFADASTTSESISISTTLDPSVSTTSDPMLPEEATTIKFEYPNFNQIYARIYNSLANQPFNPLVWRPNEFNVIQNHRQQLKYPNRLINLMPSSHRFA